MFLTGFDAKPLNTLYLDKNLIWHSLVQAYSRTNRVDKVDKTVWTELYRTEISSSGRMML